MRYAIATLLAAAVMVIASVQPAEASHPGPPLDNIHFAVAGEGEDFAVTPVSSRGRTRVRIDDRGRRGRTRVRIDDRGRRARVRIDGRGRRARVRIDDRGRRRSRVHPHFGRPPVRHFHHFHHPHGGVRIRVPGVGVHIRF